MWAMINIVQLTSHLELVVTTLPPNLELYFSLLGFSNQFLSAFPGIPNIFTYLVNTKELNRSPRTGRYLSLGYETQSILLLCGGDFQSLLLVALITPLVYVLSKKIWFVIKLDEKLRYGALIRPVIEGYFKFALCAFISFANVC